MAKVKRHPHGAASSKSGFLASLSPTTQDLLCVLFLFAVVLVLFRGIIFDRMAFSVESDTASWYSQKHAGDTIHATEGVDVLWMPYFFGGMPTFGNLIYMPHNVSYLQQVVQTLLDLLLLNGPWTWLVVYYLLNGIFMFLLMRVWKLPRVAALLAALTVMLSPYAIGLAAEGHGSKLMALSYIPLVFLLTHLLFQRRDLLSFGLLSAAIGTMMLTNHVQIVYYGFIVIGLYLLYRVILDFRTQTLVAGSNILLFAGALILGFCISSYVYLSVYEFSQFSIRGGGTAGSTGGLAYDYATNWSWNPWEIFTLLVPGFFGFQSPYYWGTMPFTNSTVYIGIIPLFLAVLGLIYRRTRDTAFVAILMGIVFLMSFGKHFSIFYNLLFSYLPFFDKFRAPAMILHLLPFTVGFLSAYGYAALIDAPDSLKDVDTTKLRRTLLYIGGGLVALLILGFVLKSSLYESLSSFMFEKEGQAEQIQAQYGQRAAQVTAQLKQLRFDILWKDFVKFVLIAGSVLGIAVAYLSRKISSTMLAGTLIAVLIIDLVILDVKFITPKPAATLEQNFRPDATITYLKQQPGLFRVFPMGDLFMDNTFAYHGLQSIGGYSPAKLKIYQTMLDSCMYRAQTPGFPLNMAVVNMLNVRYLVAQGRLPEDRFQLVNVDQTKRTMTYANSGALPRAFFVSQTVVAPTDHEVFTTLNSPEFNPATTAVLYAPLAETIAVADTPRAEVTEYASRRVTVKTVSSGTGLMVLGEIYYPAGWKAAIDGKETEILRANYILRAVVVPGGTHELVFTFDPPLYRLGWTLTNAAWGVAGLCIVIGLWSVPAVRRLVRRRAQNPPQAS
jgi:hypothetical protein